MVRCDCDRRLGPTALWRSLSHNSREPWALHHGAGLLGPLGEVNRDLQSEKGQLAVQVQGKGPRAAWSLRSWKPLPNGGAVGGGRRWPWAQGPPVSRQL